MPNQPMVTGRRHMIVAGHYLAAEAGAKILESGGNAMDAAVAAGIALGVLHSDQVQFSGVAPMLVYDPKTNAVQAIAGLGTWPKATDPDLFIRQHQGHIPLGVLRTVVPAAPDAWTTALARFGTMGFGEVARSAIRYAAEGFTVHPLMAEFIARYRENYEMWPTNKAIWLAGGSVPKVGDLLVQTDLARCLQYMADEEQAALSRCGDRAAGLKAARDAFYVGDIARQIIAFYEAEGGWLTAEDLAGFATPVEPPVSYRYGEVDVFACGPWCQGPVLLQMLNLLDGFDLAAMGHNSADYIHTVAEAMKLSFADREHYYGDPAHVDVPMDRLLSADYGARRRRALDPDRAWSGMPPPGDLPGYGGVPFVAPAGERSADMAAPDTSYTCVIDRDGMVVSATPSDVSFEGPAVPGLGICPSSRGSQSFAVAGHASAPAPGKRPRLTPNPAMAIRFGADGRPRFAMPFGAPGGDAQPQGMLQVLLNHLVFDMDIQSAIEAPRFVTMSFPNSFEPHDYAPGHLGIEGRIDSGITDALTARGHKVEQLDDLSRGVAGVLAISADAETGLLAGGADPRREARAIGW